jgi:hypothetical protein
MWLQLNPPTTMNLKFQKNRMQISVDVGAKSTRVSLPAKGMGWGRPPLGLHHRGDRCCRVRLAAWRRVSVANKLAGDLAKRIGAAISVVVQPARHIDQLRIALGIMTMTR